MADVMEIRRSTRESRGVQHPDDVPEEEVEELEQTGFDMSDREMPRPREPAYPFSRILYADPNEDSQMEYMVEWVGGEQTLEPAESFRNMDAVLEFWSGYYVETQDELIKKAIICSFFTNALPSVRGQTHRQPGWPGDGVVYQAFPADHVTTFRPFIQSVETMDRTSSASMDGVAHHGHRRLLQVLPMAPPTVFVTPYHYPFERAYITTLGCI